MAPATLYALNKEFERGISLFYSASLGSIRSALTVLLDKGHVTVTGSVENGRSKKTYEITEAGQAAFIGWMLAPIESGDLETIALAKLCDSPACRANIQVGTAPSARQIACTPNSQ
jgi:DNA-binding PadR family transcriptional regulator